MWNGWQHTRSVTTMTIDEFEWNKYLCENNWIFCCVLRIWNYLKTCNKDLNINGINVFLRRGRMWWFRDEVRQRWIWGNELRDLNANIIFFCLSKEKCQRLCTATAFEMYVVSSCTELNRWHGLRNSLAAELLERTMSFYQTRGVG